MRLTASTKGLIFLNLPVINWSIVSSTVIGRPITHERSFTSWNRKPVSGSIKKPAGARISFIVETTGASTLERKLPKLIEMFLIRMVGFSMPSCGRKSSVSSGRKRSPLEQPSGPFLSSEAEPPSPKPTPPPLHVTITVAGWRQHRLVGGFQFVVNQLLI